jgi:hypothetical protein
MTDDFIRHALSRHKTGVGGLHSLILSVTGGLTKLIAGVKSSRNIIRQISTSEERSGHFELSP